MFSSVTGRLGRGQCLSSLNRFGDLLLVARFRHLFPNRVAAHEHDDHVDNLSEPVFSEGKFPGPNISVQENTDHLVTSHSKLLLKNAWNAPHSLYLQRLSSLRSTPGIEPGIDAKQQGLCDPKLEQFLCQTKITCTDYSIHTFQSVAGIHNDNLEEFLSKPRPPWSKVRWILVEGLSFDVLKILAKKFEIHPLALEDAMHIPQRVKADFYENQLFLSLATVALNSYEGHDGQKVMPQVCIEQASIFMFRDGTLISVFQNKGQHNHYSIRDYLAKAGTLLCDSEDPSMLLHRLVDTIVDHAMPVADHYAESIAEIEEAVLEGDASASLTRSLHLLQSELNLLKKIIGPTQHMVATLKYKDKDFSQGDPQRHWLSPLTRTYLEDVHDHTLSLGENIDMSIKLSSNLINLIFSSISHKQNQSMQTLAVVSTIFLPITFLAGVYGTNFQNIPEYHWQYGYQYFWCLCISVTVAFLAVLKRMGLRPRTV